MNAGNNHNEHDGYDQAVSQPLIVTHRRHLKRPHPSRCPLQRFGSTVHRQKALHDARFFYVGADAQFLIKGGESHPRRPSALRFVPALSL
jgi:hypothetical protein